MQSVLVAIGKNLDDGLRIIDRDIDTLGMSSVVPKFQSFSLYVDHKDDLYSNIVLDDVCIVGSPTLPAVISPMKPGMNIPERSSPRAKRKMFATDVEEDSSGNSSDDSGSEWFDSDNELQKDDDDLFEDCVDHDLYEKSAQRKKKAADSESEYDSEEMDLPFKEEDESENEEVTVVDAAGKK